MKVAVERMATGGGTGQDPLLEPADWALGCPSGGWRPAGSPGSGSTCLWFEMISTGSLHHGMAVLGEGPLWVRRKAGVSPASDWRWGLPLWPQSTRVVRPPGRGARLDGQRVGADRGSERGVPGPVPHPPFQSVLRFRAGLIGDQSLAPWRSGCSAPAASFPISSFGDFQLVACRTQASQNSPCRGVR